MTTNTPITLFISPQLNPEPPLPHNTQGSTFAALNAILFLLVLILLVILFAAGSIFPEVLPHVGGLLAITITLLAGINWLIGTTGGTVTAEEQRRSLRVKGYIVEEEDRTVEGSDTQKNQ
jgi:hypothetical protein